MHCRNSIKFEGWMYINGKIIFFLYWEEEMFIFFKMQLLSLWHIMEHVPPKTVTKWIFTENIQRKQENFKVFKAKRFRWNNLTATDRQTDR